MSRNIMVEKIVPRRCFDNSITIFANINNQNMLHFTTCGYDAPQPNREERRKKKKQKGKVKLAKL